MASVLVDSYEVMGSIMYLSPLFGEHSLSDVSLKIFPILEISGFRDMRFFFFSPSGKHRYSYFLRNSFSRSKIFPTLVSLTLENK